MKTEHDKAIIADLLKAALERGVDVPKIVAERIREQAKPQTRALLDGIIKARQLLLQASASVDGLSVRLHPSDYMTIGLESRSGLIDVDHTGAPLSVLHMPLVQDVDVSIGAPVVAQNNNSRS